MKEETIILLVLFAPVLWSITILAAYMIIDGIKYTDEIETLEKKISKYKELKKLRDDLKK